jgi:biotin transport system ATP-binding protein
MIEVGNVSHAYDGKPVLCDVSLSLKEQRIAVIGGNGSGKTTFSRLLNGLILPQTGTVTVFGVSTAHDARHARRHVGLVFQNPDYQIVMPTVEEDLAFGPKNLRVPKDEIESRIRHLVNGTVLEDKLLSPAHLLSGGEKKLLSIFSVLIMQPRIAVFDEPLASLDHVNARRIRALIDALPQAVICITHDLDSIRHFCRAILFHEGCVAADGPPNNVTAVYMNILDTNASCSPSISTATRPFTGLAPVQS